MGRRLYYEEVEQIFNENGCKLLTEDYKSNRQKLEFICSCDETYTKSLFAFRKSPRCQKCTSILFSKRQTFEYEHVKKDFEDNGCILLSTVYLKANAKLDYQCVCGKISKITYSHFRQGCRCKGCPSKNKYNKENTKELIESYGCTYLDQDKHTFIARVSFICTCKRVGEKLIKSFMESPQCNQCSQEDFNEKMTGENNPRWNHGLTHEDRVHTRDYPEYITWKNEALKESDYTCECCIKRGGDLHVHHKDGYHWCKERRLDPDNAAVLCVPCHTEFHSTFGNKFNTESQYEEYLNNKLLINII